LHEAVTGLLEEDFAGRVLPFDGAAAKVFAVVAAERHRAGRRMSQLDAQIMAIARSRDAQLATRNQADFEGCGVEIVNPWLG
jgi:predicted nucleic acid-binding protein